MIECGYRCGMPPKELNHVVVYVKKALARGDLAASLVGAL